MVCINRVALAAPDPKSVLIQTLTLTLIPFVKGSQDSLRHSLLSKIEVLAMTLKTEIKNFAK